jgi:hypothetical protein
MILTKSSIRWFRKRREAEPFDQFMLAFQKQRWEKDWQSLSVYAIF